MVECEYYLPFHFKLFHTVLHSQREKYSLRCQYIIKFLVLRGYKIAKPQHYEVIVLLTLTNSYIFTAVRS